MNAITRDEALALSLPERAAVALGAAEHEVKLRELVQQSAAIVAVTNKAGREECHSAYMKLKTTRVNIGHKVNEVTEDAKLFTKAVKTEAERLVGIMVAEEDRLQALRDTWDEAEQARKDALIAAERARVEAIADRIAALREDETDAVRKDKTAEQTRATLEYSLARPVTPELFEERFDEAVAAHAEVVASIRATLAQREADEVAAAQAEADRQAELKAIANQKAEQARIAAAQAAKEKELADAAAELQRKRDEDAAAARAAQQEVERLAKAEADKVAAANAAAAKAIADAAADLAAKQAAFQKQQDDAAAAAVAAEEARVKAEILRDLIAVDHEAALVEDAERTAARIAEKQIMVDDAVAAGHDQAADERIAGMPAGALGVDALLDAADADAEEMDDSEFVRKVADALGMTIRGVVNRMSEIDFDAARTLAEAA